MSKIAPFHSTRPGETKYHDNNACTEGNNIEQQHLAQGTDGRQICDHCARLG